MARLEEGNKNINDKNCENVPKTTDTCTQNPFANEGLEEQDNFPRKEEADGEKNNSVGIKIASVVGRFELHENKNVRTKSNNYFANSTEKGFTTSAAGSHNFVAAGSHNFVAASNLGIKAKGYIKNEKYTTGLNTYCIDFLEGCWSPSNRVAGTLRLGVAPNAENAVPKRILSIANVETVTGIKRKKTTGNERDLTNESFQESSSMTVSLKRDTKQSSISENNAPTSADISDVAPNFQNTIPERILSNANMKAVTAKEREKTAGNEKDLTNELFEESSTMTVSVKRGTAQSSTSENNAPMSANGDGDGKDGSFSCKICCLCFSVYNGLVDHLRRSHVVETGYKRSKCGSCEKEFLKSEFLITHLLNHHAEKKIYCCGECGTKFPYAHSTTARRSTKFYCGRCQIIPNGRKSQKAKGASENQLRVVNTHSCEFCREVFSLKYELERHLRFSHSQKPHACEVCGKKYASSHSLRHHSLTHQSPTIAGPSKLKLSSSGNEHFPQGRSYTCKVCGENFAFLHLLRNHSLTHNAEPSKLKLSPPRIEHFPEEKSCTCKICGNQYDKRISLACHSGTHNLKQSCDSCEKVFSNVNNHDTGTCLNSNIDDVECESTFSSPRASKLHLGSRSKRPTCEICGKGFVSSYLKIHRRIHTGERPYVCDICQKGFVQRAGMVAHRRTHSPFECNVCQQGFVCKADLNTHQLSHVKIEPDI